MFSQPRATEHRDGDDLLTAGLGLAGLRDGAAPFADAARPTPAELRWRALWANWRGSPTWCPAAAIAMSAAAPATGAGPRVQRVRPAIPGARQPHRVLVQLPDGFDAAKRCVVVAASSGSAASTAPSRWPVPGPAARLRGGLNDKGAGTDYFDLDAGRASPPMARSRAPTRRWRSSQPRRPKRRGRGLQARAFAGQPQGRLGPPREAGRAIRAGHAGCATPQQAPFTFANTRVIAVGISNGGGAVLRAAEDGEPGWMRWLPANPTWLAAMARAARNDYNSPRPRC